MTFAEDAARLLGKPPRDDAAPAPEPARREALVVVKRAETALAKDPVAGLKTYLEALDLDPACKAAYEGILKTVLARADGDRPALEGALRYAAEGLRRLPQDAALRELEKKVRVALPPAPAEPALAAKTHKAPEPRPMAGHGAGRTCKFCGSPIPIGSPECRSCSMSGELPKPGGVVDRSRAGPPVALLVAVAVVGLAVGGGVLYVAFGRAKPPATDPKKP